MYLTWGTKTLPHSDDHEINALYDEGYLFTRLGKGILNKTRSIRVKLSDFEYSSENKRILKKIEDLAIKNHEIPYPDYHWQIAKMAKDFYDTKFGAKTFSANKMKELITDEKTSNFNLLLEYCKNDGTETLGYAICREANEFLHYAYPFYTLNATLPNLGMGMMLRAIEWALAKKKKYTYLGSAQRPADTYKLQFKGLEWLDGNKWQNNQEVLKAILKT